MAEYKTYGELSAYNLSQIRKFNTYNCNELITSLESLIGKKFKDDCKVTSIDHYYDIRIVEKITHSSIGLSEYEYSGEDIDSTDEPTELYMFDYEKLKQDAYEVTTNHIYRGVLYGTVKTYNCAPTVECNECNGSGNCSQCDGEGHVGCDNCGGDGVCVECCGNNNTTCETCGGDGICTTCENGQITCYDCNGDGEVYCPDCNGSGNYIDEECAYCNGKGYRSRKQCPKCGGSGRYVQRCIRCDNRGRIRCGTCNGDGEVWCNDCGGNGKCNNCGGSGEVEFYCDVCEGSGNCNVCDGDGTVTCPVCDGEENCNVCDGNGSVTCQRCDGTGLFQECTEYSITENTKEYVFFPIKTEDTQINGELLYKGTVFENFSNHQKSQKNKQELLEKINEQFPDKESSTIESWLDNNMSEIEKQLDDTDEFYIKAYVNAYKIPITKVAYKYNSSFYIIWIVGKNLAVVCDDFPSVVTRLFTKIKKLF